MTKTRLVDMDAPKTDIEKHVVNFIRILQQVTADYLDFLHNTGYEDKLSEAGAILYSAVINYTAATIRVLSSSIVEEERELYLQGAKKHITAAIDLSMNGEICSEESPLH